MKALRRIAAAAALVALGMTMTGCELYWPHDRGLHRGEYQGRGERDRGYHQGQDRGEHDRGYHRGQGRGHDKGRGGDRHGDRSRDHGGDREHRD